MVISVVVPIYKVEKYIHRCVDSILSQSFTDFELILVDDGSPDACGKICDEYAEKDSRIRVIHQKNGGLSAARNSGIDIAQGEWLSFIDSDDWVHPDYLRLLYEAAVENSTDISIGLYVRTDGRGDIDNAPINPRISIEQPEGFWIEKRTNATVAWGKLYRWRLFDGVRYPVGKYHEDEYVTYRLLFACDKIAVVNAPLYRYFVNTDSISGMNYIKRMPDIIKAFTQHLEFFKDSLWQEAYRLEVEKYAEAYSNAIWLIKNNEDAESKKKTEELRIELRAFMETYKSMIPFEKRKDIYISAYPKQEPFIRGFGFIKQLLNN